MKLVYFCLFVASLSGIVLGVEGFSYKNLGGPPSEFSLHMVPSPENASISSFYQTLQVNVSTEVTAESSFVIDCESMFKISFYSAQNVPIVDPSTGEVLLSLVPNNGTNQPASLGDPYVETLQWGTDYVNETTFVVENAWAGNYSVVLSSALFQSLHNVAPVPSYVGLYVVIWSDNEVGLSTNLISYNLTLGEPVGVVARLYNSTEHDDKAIFTVPKALVDGEGEVMASVVTAQVGYPDGTVAEIQLLDNGLNGDGKANDGVFGGYLMGTEPGNYRVLTQFNAVHAQTNKVLTRHQSQLIPLVDARLSVFYQDAWLEVNQDDDTVTIYIPVEADITYDNSLVFRPYAEIWLNGKAVAFATGLSQVQEVEGFQVLTLVTQMQWFYRMIENKDLLIENPFATNQELVLKNVYIQDPTNQLPLAQEEEVPVSMSSDDWSDFYAALGQCVSCFEGDEITTRMRKGIKPENLRKTKVSSSSFHQQQQQEQEQEEAPGYDGDGTLVMVHGYCSAENFWKQDSDDFTNAVYFEDLNANRGNDEFAQLILTFIEDQNVDATSFIAHSQGGLAILHLYNYYWSPVDETEEGRILQSLQSPYLGNTGAGTAADIINIFGFGCGEQTDLTRDGANLWLSGVTTESRQQVYFYKTQYGTSLFNAYCNLATSLVLKAPNDGTAEVDYEALEGANDQGLVKSECHSVKMHYDPGYLDNNRNLEMNAYASRG